MPKLCPLDNEHKIQVMMYVKNSIAKAVANKEPFDLNTFLGDFYRSLVADGMDVDRAISYIHLTPSIIDIDIRRNEPNRDYLMDNGLDLNELVKTMRRFKTAEDPLMEVANYLADESGVKEKGLLKVIEGQAGTKEGVDEEPEQALEPTPRFNSETAFHARALNLLTTSGAEANAAGIPFPEKVGVYNFQKNLIKKLKDSGKIDSSYLDVIEGGVFLTAMRASQLGTHKPAYINAVAPVMVITDKEGRMAFFDTDHNLVRLDGQDRAGGNPMIYEMRDFSMKDGKMELTNPIISVEALATRKRRHGETVNEAELAAAREEEMNMLRKIEDYVTAKNEEGQYTNTLMTVITDGSMGYIPYNHKARTMLKDLSFAGDPLKLQIQEFKDSPTGLSKGAIFFYQENVDNPIQVDRKEMSRELVNKLASTLVDDIFLQKPNREYYPMDNGTRMEKVLQYRANSLKDDKIQFVVGETDGNITLNLGGTAYTVTPASKEAVRSAIVSFFTSFQSYRTYDPTQDQMDKAIDQKEKGWKSKLRRGSISKRTYGDTTSYFVHIVPEITINKYYMNSPRTFDNYTLAPRPDGTGLVFTSDYTKDYITFLTENTFAKYEPGPDKKLRKLNSYFYFKPLPKEVEDKLTPKETVEPIEEPDIPLEDNGSEEDPEDLEIQKILDAVRKSDLKKSIGVKGLEVRATEDQIAAAKVWWESSPLKDKIDFNEMFHIMNHSAVGEFFNGAITLYMHADYSDLYHESWHAFSQLYLSRKDKQKLYASIAKMSGSFVNRQGQRVRFRDPKLTLEDIEEYLAEDFRKYMLSGGSATTTNTVRNTFFRKILNFFKALFGNTTYRQLMIDQQSTASIKDLYEKLRLGNLSEFSFSVDNAMFGGLEKGITALNDEEVVKELGPSDSLLARETLDSLFSSYLTAVNTGRGKKMTSYVFKSIEGRAPAYQFVLQNLIKQERKLRKKIGVTDAGLAETNTAVLNAYVQLHFPVGKEFTYTTATAEKKGVVKTYLSENGKVTHLVTEDGNIPLGQIQDTHKSPPEKMLTTQEVTHQQRNLDLISYLVRNFGNPDNPAAYNVEGNGVIAYHTRKSEYLSFEDKFYEDSADNNDKEAYNFKAGNETSVFEAGKSEVWYMVRGLHATLPDGSPDLNRLGFPRLVDFDSTKNRLAKILKDSVSVQEMWDKLGKEAKKFKFPYLNQLMVTLGSPDTPNNPELQKMWTAFWVTFNRYQIDQPTVLVDRIGGYETKDGERIPSTKHWLTKAGIAQTDTGRITRMWDNYFTSGVTRNAYIIRKTKRAEPLLDVTKVRNDFPNAAAINKDRVAFLRAIGLTIDTDNTDLVKDIQDSKDLKGFGEFMSDRLSDILTDGGNIKSVSSFFMKPILDVVKAKKEDRAPKESKENKSYGILSRMYLEHTDKFSDASVTTPEGDKRYTLSLNSSMTAIAKGLNSGKSFSQLVNGSYMSYLDFNRNPWAKRLKTLQTLYDFDSVDAEGVNTFERRVNVEYILENVAGLSVLYDGQSTNTGVSTANADEPTTLSMSLANFLQLGVLANPTPGEKSTRYSTRPSRYQSPYSHTGMYWMDVKYFAPKHKNDLSGAIYNSTIDYLYAEHERIMIMRNLEDGSDQAENNYLTYKKNGKQFHLFDGILSEDTKKLLLDPKVLHGASLEEFMAGATAAPGEEVLEIKSRIAADFDAYWEKTFQLNRDLFAKGAYIGDNVLNDLVSRRDNTGFPMAGFSDFKSSPTTRARLTQAVMDAFTFNSFIHNVESTIINYGDQAQYATEVEFHKRIAMYSSTGDIFRTDNSMMDELSNALTSSYAASIGINFKGAKDKAAFTSVLNTAVLKDPELTSAYIKKIEKALRADIKQRWQKAGKDLIDLEDEVQRQVKAYKEMKVGDGQGWVSFDSYRLLSMAVSDWTDAQENLFQLIVSNKEIDPSISLLEHFPILKYQYAGPLATKTGLPVMGGHKFSLMPLIPNVIKGFPTLEKMHHKMMNENIDYVLLKSGSKMTTITDGDQVDQLYNNNEDRTFDPGISKKTGEVKQYTVNPVYLEFLKKQQNTSKVFKGQSILSTQLRKIIEEGLVEGGVPVDFMPGTKDITTRLKKWDALSESEKRAHPNAGKTYTLYKDYELAIERLTLSRKKKLIKDLGWDKPGAYGKVNNKLIKKIEKELIKQDVSEHELESIQLRDDLTKALKYKDLSVHLSQEIIERVLLSLVNRTLVRQKINGEPLIQASEIGTEDMNRWKPSYKFAEPTDTQLDEFGTDGLTYYQEGKGPDRTTSAIKVKIAMQGSFEHLLHAIHRDGERIGTIPRLNEMIRDVDWLDAGNNRRLITMVATRIPVQGLNSMEFMEVFEFLPRSAGNMIILPAEIVAKSGSDFDIDKMTVYMPNLQATYSKSPLGYTPNGATLAQDYSEKELKELYEEFKKAKEQYELMKAATDEEKKEITAGLKKELFPKERFEMYDKIFEVIFGVTSAQLDEEQFIEFFEEQSKSIKNLDDFISQAKSFGKTEENDVLWTMRNILATPSNYASLVRPNATYTLDPIANGEKKEGEPDTDGLRDYVSDYNPKTGDKISGSSLMQFRYNLYVHMVNKVGQEALAIAAVDNTFNILFNRIGATMNHSWMDGTSKKPAIIEKLITLFMPHNTTKQTITTKDDEGNEVQKEVDVISLAHMYDANNQEKISDNVSQIINLLLEIAKNDSAFYLQLNREIIPTLLFMNQAGVPIKQLIYFASQPVIREYMEEIRKARSPIAEVMGWAPMARDNDEEEEKVKKQFAVIHARTKMLNKPGLYVDIGQKAGSPGNSRSAKAVKNVYKEMMDLADNELNPGLKERAFSEDGLFNKIKKTSEDGRSTPTEEDKLVLLHWFHVEDIAKSIRDVKMRLNFDTKSAKSLYMAMNKKMAVEALVQDQKISYAMATKMLEESPISSLYLVDPVTGSPFVHDLIKPILPLRANTLMTKYLTKRWSNYNEQETITGIFGDLDKGANKFFNDFMSYLFQMRLRGFNPLGHKKFRNINSVESVDIKRVPHLNRGAAVQDGVMYYDMTTLRNDFRSKAYIDFRTVSVPEEKDKKGKKTKKGAELPKPLNHYSKRGLASVHSKALTSINEYFNFVFEREYIRSTVPLADVSTNSHYLDLLLKNRSGSQALPRKDEWSETEYEAELDKVTYEQYIRDAALDNIANGWKLFESSSNYAQQVEDTITKYDLDAKYGVLKNLKLSAAVSGTKLVNIKMTDYDLTADKIDSYHADLQDLANPGVIKVDDPAENLYISRLFGRMPVYAFLQSGLSTAGEFSLTRIVPSHNIMEYLNGVVEEFTQDLNESNYEEKLTNFYKKWKQQNTNYHTRNRYKNYTDSMAFKENPWYGVYHVLPEHRDLLSEAEVGKLESIIERALPTAEQKAEAKMLLQENKEKLDEAKKTLPVYALNPDYDLYDTVDMTSKSPEATAAAHPDILFLFDQATSLGETPPLKSNSQFQKASHLKNVIGLVTKMGYREEERNTFTDATLDLNKLKIEQGIQEILRTIEKQGLRVAFPVGGLGQTLLGYGSDGKSRVFPAKFQPAPFTFAYLSQRLFQEFGYVNPHYEQLELGDKPDELLPSGSFISGVSLGTHVTNKDFGYTSLEADQQMMEQSQAVIAFPASLTLAMQSSPTLTHKYLKELKKAGIPTGNQVFTGARAVWVFGNVPQSKGGYEITPDVLKSIFETNYKPMIDFAIGRTPADGVQVFNVGKKGGIEQMVRDYLNKQGFVGELQEGDKADDNWYKFMRGERKLKQVNEAEIEMIKAGDKTTIWNGTQLELGNYQLSDGTMITINKVEKTTKAGLGKGLQAALIATGYPTISKIKERNLESITKFFGSEGAIHIHTIEMTKTEREKALAEAQTILNKKWKIVKDTEKELAKVEEYMNTLEEAEEDTGPESDVGRQHAQLTAQLDILKEEMSIFEGPDIILRSADNTATETYKSYKDLMEAFENDTVLHELRPQAKDVLTSLNLINYLDEVSPEAVAELSDNNETTFDILPPTEVLNAPFAAPKVVEDHIMSCITPQ